MTAIDIDAVSKKFRRPARALSSTLKSYLLRDAWRKPIDAPGESADSIWVLRDVCLQVPKGRTVGVIGRNGSGKSTLLKLMARILKPDRGSLAVNGKVAALIELGAGFHPELTGRENIMINGIILGLTRAEIRARMGAIIEFADIGEFIDYPVRTYSSGMYARLGFAVAVNVDPDVLLIDEVLSVGDADFSKKCYDALDRFKQAGKSIVVVSHSLRTVRTWCDDAVWLDRGEVRMVGSAESVVDAYSKVNRSAAS